MTFLAWKPGHMITFLVCVNFFLFFSPFLLFSFSFLYWDYRLTRLTIEISGRENGGDVDSGMISFKKDRRTPSLINTKT